MLLRQEDLLISLAESTIQKLFNAQKLHPDAEPIVSHDHVLESQHRPLPQKSTLHAFWNIKQPMPVFNIPCPPDHTTDPRCEDCDRDLAPDPAMAAIVGLDRYASCSCFDCGRRICDLCAVTRDVRRCLECLQVQRS